MKEEWAFPPNYKLCLTNAQLEREQGAEALPSKWEGICMAGVAGGRCGGAGN